MEHDAPQAKLVSDLLERDFPIVASYICPEILPIGGTFIFGGEAKIGKSWFMTEFARSLVTGAAPFDYDGFWVPAPVKVLVLEQELGERGLRERFKKVFSVLPDERWKDKFWYESKKPELQLDSPTGKRYIADMIKDVKPNVLILDPISMMHGYNENNADEIAELFRTLEKFKGINPEEGMSVVLSHHFGKPHLGPDGAISPNFDRLSPYNFRGSSKWKDTPDSICTMSRGKVLKVDWEAWEVHVRWITRHSSSPPEMTLTVCGDADDGRVRFKKPKTPITRKIVEGPYKEVKRVPVSDDGPQLVLTPV